MPNDNAEIVPPEIEAFSDDDEALEIPAKKEIDPIIVNELKAEATPVHEEKEESEEAKLEEEKLDKEMSNKVEKAPVESSSSVSSRDDKTPIAPERVLPPAIPQPLYKQEKTEESEKKEKIEIKKESSLERKRSWEEREVPSDEEEKETRKKKRYKVDKEDAIPVIDLLESEMEPPQFEVKWENPCVLDFHVGNWPRPATWIFTGCKHKCLCTRCMAGYMMMMAHNSNRCPVCGLVSSFHSVK